MAAYTVTPGTVDTIRLNDYEPHTDLVGAELVGNDGTVAAVVLEPQARHERRAGWNEYQWREDVRQALHELQYEGSDSYSIVWDPGRDQTEEEPLTATPAYAGWTIEYEIDESSLGDMSGLDIEQSMRRFRDLLDAALREQFPGAVVEVSIDWRSYNGGKVQVFGPGALYAPMGLRDEAQDFLDRVSDVAYRVWMDRAEEWAVEV